jgi:hypothetical protein
MLWMRLAVASIILGLATFGGAAQSAEANHGAFYWQRQYAYFNGQVWGRDCLHSGATHQVMYCRDWVVQRDRAYT